MLRILATLWVIKLTLSDTSLKTCLHRITSQSLNHGSVWLSMTSWDLVDAKYFENFTRQGHTFSVKMSDIIDTGYDKKTQNYIIEAVNSTELSHTLQSFKDLSSWNSHGKFFIIAQIYNDSGEISNMVENLWFEGIYNFVILTTDKDQSEVVKVLTWFPYNCRRGSDYTKVRLLDVCINGIMRNNSNLFPKKIPKVFNWCQVKVGTTEWPPYIMKATKRVANTDEYIIKEGLEVRIVDAISSKLHLNVSYFMSEKNLNWGILYDNGTGTGLMALLRNHQVDMAIASFTLSLPKFKFFEISHSYFVESYYWCVPHAEAQSPWKKVVNAISYKLWIALFLSLFTVSLLMCGLSKLGKETVFRGYIYNLQTTISVLLGVSIPNRPKTQILRWIFTYWILFSLNFSVFYQTKLVSILAKPTFLTQIASIEDILNNNLNILVPLHILNKNSTFSIQVLKQSEDCTNMKECFARVVNNKDSALYLSSTYTSYMKKSYVNKDNVPLIYCFPSTTASYPVIALMKQGYPLAHLFDNIITRLIEGGFVNLWEDQIYKQKYKNEEMALNETDDTFLNLKKLSSAFSFLFLGLVFAGAVFLGEVIYFLVKFMKGKQIFIVESK